jgi:hypothetical protein
MSRVPGILNAEESEGATNQGLQELDIPQLKVAFADIDSPQVQSLLESIVTELT